MKIGSGIIVFVVVLFVFVGIAKHIILHLETKKIHEIAKQQSIEQTKTSDKILELKSETIKKFVYDYTYWDDMVEFVNNKNPNFAAENIEDATKQFGISAIAILDKNGEIFYFYSKTNNIKRSLIPIESINIKEPAFLHFFIKTQNSVVEFHGAPIQPSGDTARTSMPQGYMIAAKEWDAAYLEDIETLLQGDIKILSPNEKQKEEEGTIHADIVLKNVSNEPEAIACIASKNVLSDFLEQYRWINITIDTISWMIFVTALLYFMARFVSIPLRNISSALKDRDPSSIKQYLKNSDEYSEISSLAISSFAQTKELERLNLTLEQKVEDAIKEIRKKDELLFQHSKLTAMGELLNNIAHQWRQPINVVALTLSRMLIAKECDKMSDELFYESIKKGEEALQQMSKTIDDFKNFFRPSTKCELFSLQDVIENLYSLIKPTLEDLNITPTIHLTKENIEVYGYKNELSQSLLNIIDNSKDAIVHSCIENGEMDISLSLEGEYAKIEIIDNGGGIKKEILSKVFEPYFTTKQQGEGIGIGLYMAKQTIEENMLGKLEVENRENGALVRVFLPKIKS